MIKIAIADDYKIYRDGLKVGLSADENMQVLFEADNGEDLMKGLETVSPDVIIMDLKMPILNCRWYLVSGRNCFFTGINLK